MRAHDLRKIDEKRMVGITAREYETMGDARNLNTGFERLATAHRSAIVN